ncbi:hypothetical protein CIPAW_02G159500 [Carya illinoinensis]|uniref:Uncharacterized protein n=1 Tax=Carya illinoinensis TaxID=32201 RepID=A0A8T1RHL3_CARIL|nr:hypothetical protein CIPAW_02G159500 [Carya illinoinensis]
MLHLCIYNLLDCFERGFLDSNFPWLVFSFGEILLVSLLFMLTPHTLRVFLFFFTCRKTPFNGGGYGCLKLSSHFYENEKQSMALLLHHHHGHKPLGKSCTRKKILKKSERPKTLERNPIRRENGGNLENSSR